MAIPSIALQKWSSCQIISTVQRPCMRGLRQPETSVSKYPSTMWKTGRYSCHRQCSVMVYFSKPNNYLGSKKASDQEIASWSDALCITRYGDILVFVVG